MSNLSNGLVPTERLQKIASWREKYGNNHNVMIPAEEAELLARELLAFREAQGKPSLNVQFKGGWPVPELVGLIAGASLFPDGAHDFYAAPQLPVVLDGIDYKALVMIIAEIAHGGRTDISLLPVTIRSLQQRCVSIKPPAKENK